MCKDVEGMIYGKPGKCEYVGKLCPVQLVLNPTLFSKILCKKALAQVFVYVRKGDRYVLAWKNFCFDQFSNRIRKNQNENNQEYIKTQNIFPQEIRSERYTICIFFSQR